MTKTYHVKAEVVDSYSATISRFMNWAAERIAREVEENERVEAQAGTRDFIPGSGDAKKQDYTLQEKIDILEGVDKLRSQKMTLARAVKDFGIHTSTYYKWKKDIKN